MNRCYALAALLLLNFVPAALCAAPTPSTADRIESLKSQYLAAVGAPERKQCIGELKSLVKNSSGVDSVAINSAIGTMLPAAASPWEAEELLTIAAAVPSAHAIGDSAQAGDSEFLLEPRAAAAQAGSPKGDVETLADVRVDRLQQDSGKGEWLDSAHVQQIWRVNTLRGASEFSPRPIVYSGISESLSLLRARVLKSNGREEQAVASPDRAILRRDASMYFDARARELRFPHLQPGDLVEVEYVLLPLPQAHAWPGYFARLDQLRTAFPARLQRRVMIAPSNLKLYAVARGLTPVERQQGDQSVRVWEARDAAAAQPFLHVSTIGSVEDFGRWYSQLLQPVLELDDNLQNVAQKIAARNLSVEGRVHAVYESVQRLTKYAGFEFGVHSFQPYPVSMVERRGFGDCKDKAAMLVALLRAVGVQAEFAMIRTRAAGEVGDGAYSAQQFDHAIVFVPQLDLYLDGTAPSTSPGPLPYNDVGAMAITVDAQGNATRRTVVANAGDPAFRNGTQPASQANAGASMATEQRP